MDLVPIIHYGVMSFQKAPRLPVMAAGEYYPAGRVLSLAAMLCSFASCREVSASWPATTCSRPLVWFHVWNSSPHPESCSHSELFSPRALSYPLRSILSIQKLLDTSSSVLGKLLLFQWGKCFLFTSLFIWGCAGSSLPWGLFSSCEQGMLSRCGPQACFSLRWLLLLWSSGSRACGLQDVWLKDSVDCGSQVLEHRVDNLWHVGLAALRHVGSSWTREQSYVPCIGRQILNHWTTREVLASRLQVSEQTLALLHLV